MKKLLVFLCVVFMILGAVACNESSTGKSLSEPVKSVTTQTDVDGGGGGSFANAPEPATILLLGSGLVGLAGVGRKKLFNKDRDEG